MILIGGGNRRIDPDKSPVAASSRGNANEEAVYGDYIISLSFSESWKTSLIFKVL